METGKPMVVTSAQPQSVPVAASIITVVWQQLASDEDSKEMLTMAKQ